MVKSTLNFTIRFKMKNIAIINTSDYSSTGKIATELYTNLTDYGYNVYFCYGRGKEPNDTSKYRIDYKWETFLHVIQTRLLGTEGIHSTYATRRLVSRLREWKIDTVIAINLHGYYINTPILFDYLKQDNIRFIYIMADESPYLGKCGVKNDCDKYLTGCHHCPYYKRYPFTWFFDRASYLYKIKDRNYGKLGKRHCFVGPQYVIENAKLAPLTRNLNLKAVDEAINVELYKPSDYNRLLLDLGINKDKIIIVCVASLAAIHKGGNYFIELAKRFECDNRFEFLLISRNLNGNSRPSCNLTILGYIEKLEDLARYYSMADLFVCPSLSDTQPNTCIEALACGTPLLCFNISGMPYIGGQDVMTLVEARNVDQLAEVVNKTRKKTEELSIHCREYAVARYDSRTYASKIINIANQII